MEVVEVVEEGQVVVVMVGEEGEIGQSSLLLSLGQQPINIKK